MITYLNPTPWCLWIMGRNQAQSRLDLSYANLSGTDLSYANLSGTDLSYANLSDANLRCANLSDANLSDANLSGTDLLDANLSYADLRDADLRCANLRCANLRDASLRDADLSYANLSGTNLSGTNLSYADLRCANLRDADLRDADLGGANLLNAAASNLRPESIGLPESDGEMARIVAARILDAPEGLDMVYWHTCRTTHCLAGWAVHLSGAAGYALEAVTSPSVAGCILMPEASHLFFSSNTEAIKWAKRTVGEAAEKE